MPRIAEQDGRALFLVEPEPACAPQSHLEKAVPMRLKKLVLDGFKSFGRKTEFDFERGITAVVGPNGCGKSNVVDAFRWVLGVSSAKAIRGQEMTDMIFDGGAINRPAPHAQVKLLFDNADGFFRRATTDEVEISRKLSRDGKSEYFLNGEVCRKRDLRALFADTGIGIEAYSVIEQGKIDLLLRHDPQERRKIFEEAAGINQYKEQRRQAELRLERAERNLTRLNDIMEELKSQIRKVRTQAGKARRYREYTRELHQLRIEKSLREYRALRTVREQLLRQSASLAAELAEMEQKHEQAKEALAEAEAEQEERQNEVGELLQKLNSIEVELREHETKRDTHAQRLEEIEELRTRRADMERLNAGRRESLVSQRGTLQQAIADIEAELKAGEDAYTALSNEVAELYAEIEERETSQAARMKEIEELERRREALSRSHSTLASDVRIARHDLLRLERECAEVEEQGRAAATEAKEIEATLADVAAQTQELGEQRAAARRALTEARDAVISAQDERAKLAEEVASLKARQATLQEMLDSQEGLASGTAHLLNDEALRERVRVQGTVMDLLEPAATYAALVEAVLGTLGEAVVVPEIKDGFAALEALAAEGKGGATLLALSALRNPMQELPAAKSLGTAQQGIVGWLHELLTPAKGAKHAVSTQLIDNLFPGVLVVNDLASARAVLGKLPQDASVATLDGHVVRWPGWLYGKPEAAGLITVRSQLAELEQKLEAAAAQTEAAAKAVGDAQAQAEQAEQQAAEADEQLQQVALESRDLDGELKRLQQSAAQATDRKQQAERELEELGEKVDDGSERLAEVEEQQRDVEKQLAALSDFGSDDGPSLTDLRRSHKEKAETLQEQRTFRSEQSHRIETNRQQLTHIEENLRNLAAEEERLVEEMQRAESQESESRQIVESASREVERLREEGQGFVGQRDDLEKQLAIVRQRVTAQRNNVDESASRCETLRSSAIEARTREESCVERMQELQKRAQEELELDIEDELERVDRDIAEQSEQSREAAPSAEAASDDASAESTDDEEADSDDGEELTPEVLARQVRALEDAAIQARIEELNEKIRKLGPVNMAALEELDELEEKKAFLDKQHEDLAGARNEIRRIVQDIDRRTKSMFLKTFEEIRENFQKLFRKLFNGGGADVYLLDPEEPLISGIEIKARPPGNEPRTLTLLSGGQRSMIAIAMIFAVFQTKPSPFCILDEVDAALDDANKQRFAGLVREFSGSTQFLVITHSKATMAASDLMYGITMQERGISKRIHVRFEQVEETEDGEVEFHDLDEETDDENESVGSASTTTTTLEVAREADEDAA